MSDSPDDVQEDFATLLERVRRGDAEATARLVERYEPRVRLTARLLLGPLLRPWLDSADLTQSVHRTLLMRLRKDKVNLESPDQLVALLVTLVRRKVAQHWRKAQRQRRGDGANAPTTGAVAGLTGSEPNPANSAAVNDAVARLLQDLPAIDRRMLELRLAGARTADAAEELGLDARVLRARLSRLRKRLREQGVLDEWL